MKIKVTELTGAALDWAAAKCEGWNVSVDEFLRSQLANSKFAYSTVWAKGGPIIEREKITVANLNEMEGWIAYIGAVERRDGLCGDASCYGPTPLVAAMRCYVASKLGDEVEIPEELK